MVDCYMVSSFSRPCQSSELMAESMLCSISSPKQSPQFGKATPILQQVLLGCSWPRRQLQWRMPIPNRQALQDASKIQANQPNPNLHLRHWSGSRWGMSTPRRWGQDFRSALLEDRSGLLLQASLNVFGFPQVPWHQDQSRFNQSLRIQVCYELGRADLPAAWETRWSHSRPELLDAGRSKRKHRYVNEHCFRSPGFIDRTRGWDWYLRSGATKAVPKSSNHANNFPERIIEAHELGEFARQSVAVAWIFRFNGSFSYENNHKVQHNHLRLEISS